MLSTYQPRQKTLTLHRELSREHRTSSAYFRTIWGGLTKSLLHFSFPENPLHLMEIFSTHIRAMFRISSVPIVLIAYHKHYFSAAADQSPLCHVDDLKCLLKR